MPSPKILFGMLTLTDWWMVYAIVGFGYLLLILFVSNAKKSRSSQLVKEVTKSSFTTDIVKEINTVHVQQFLANEITTLRTFLQFKDKIKLASLPQLNSAFPRRVRDE